MYYEIEKIKTSFESILIQLPSLKFVELWYRNKNFFGNCFVMNRFTIVSVCSYRLSISLPWLLKILKILILENQILIIGNSVLKIYSKFTEEHPCQSAISIKLLCSFIEIAFRRGFSSVYLLYIFRTPFLKNTSGRLFLWLFMLQGLTVKYSPALGKWHRKK